MTLVLITVAAIAFIMAIMAVGVIFSNRALRGSCGGPAILDPDGDPISCGNCNCRVPEPEHSEAS
jgi:hypothetical protein